MSLPINLKEWVKSLKKQPESPPPPPKPVEMISADNLNKILDSYKIQYAREKLLDNEIVKEIQQDKVIIRWQLFMIYTILLVLMGYGVGRIH